jgi:hypothetical protein
MLVDVLIWLMAVYGCSSLLATLFARYIMNRMVADTGEQFHHYMVLLYNSEHSLERAVRRLLFFSTMYGKPISISFVDFGSTDDTLKIAEKFEQDYLYLIAENQQESTATIKIDLRSTDVAGSG